jgi:hypothetical protein
VIPPYESTVGRELSIRSGSSPNTSADNKIQSQRVSPHVPLSTLTTYSRKPCRLICG